METSTEIPLHIAYSLITLSSPNAQSYSERSSALYNLKEREGLTIPEFRITPSGPMSRDFGSFFGKLEMIGGVTGDGGLSIAGVDLLQKIVREGLETPDVREGIKDLAAKIDFNLSSLYSH